MAAARLSDEDIVRLGTDIQRRIGVKTSRNEPLKRFTTMRVGGPADLFAEVHNLFELRAIGRPESAVSRLPSKRSCCERL